MRYVNNFVFGGESDHQGFWIECTLYINRKTLQSICFNVILYFSYSYLRNVRQQNSYKTSCVLLLLCTCRKIKMMFGWAVKCSNAHPSSSFLATSKNVSLESTGPEPETAFFKFNTNREVTNEQTR